MKHKWLAILILASLLLNSGTALAHETATPLAAIPPWTVRIAALEPASIDPAFTSTSNDINLSNQLFSGLTRIDPDTNAPIPDLASSWTMSPDAKQFTFTLRNGIQWSNGTPITAYDFHYSILRALNPATGSEWAYILFAINNAEEYNNGTITNPNLVGVTVLSSTQVKFTLESPASYFPAILAMSIAHPVPASAIAAWGLSWTEPGHIVTSGPYRLTEWVHNNYMTFDKNASYYDASNVQIQHVSVKLTDETTAWNLFLAHELDTVDVPLSVLGAVRTDPELSPLLHSVGVPCNYYYGFSTSQPPFDDPLVRKAFIAAVNRQGLIDTVLGGVQQLAQTFTSKGIFGHVDGASEGVGIPYNPSQARQWLSDAGYPNGTGLPPITLWFSNSAGHQSTAEYIKQNWTTNLNVTVTLQSLPWSDYLAQIGNGGFQIWRMGWCADYNDAYDFLHEAVVPSAGNYGGWSNATYLNLLSQAALSNNNAARLLYYKQAEEILVETDAVMLPLYFYATPVVTRAYLQRPYTSQDVHIRDWHLTAPMVLSSTRTDANPTSATSVNFTVTFSEAVTGVDMVGPTFDDFALTASPGISGASITGVSDSDTTYTVTVNTGTGSGTIRLDVPVTATINDLSGNPLANLPFTSGESYAVRSVNVYIGGALKGSYFLAAGQSTRPSYAGMDSGPVKVESTNGMPIIAAIRDAWAVNGVTTSFSQLMGLPLEQLSNKYVFPGYNNVTLNEQLRIANVDTVQTTVTVMIGGVLRGTYTLYPPGSLLGSSAVRINYPGLDSGPVVIEGTAGVDIISAIREAWAVNGVTTSFVQLMGLPAGQLSNKYVFPAYNNVTLNEQLRIANVDTVQSTVTVRVGGVLKGTYTLYPPGSPLGVSAVRINYPSLDSGPVVVEGTPNVKIISSIRDAWAVNGVTTSFSQLMGMPAEQLSNKYLFPAYNNVTLNEQLRISNVDTVQSAVTVTIGGVLKGTYTLYPPGSPLGASAVRINYPGLDSGPVVVEGTPNVEIISAIREAWAANGVTKSFVQLMGLPAGQLSTTYLFPAYNNVTLNEQLRFGVP